MPKVTRRRVGPKSEPGKNKRSEWEEIRCPICMEHPHHPRLLVCNSRNCNPYICDTSSTLSNCLTQFMRSSSSTSCPLCRGEITGYTKVTHGAFSYMNSKSRSCPKEDCEISGNYKELMKHVRKNHPKARRPSEVERKRRQDWESLQEEIDFEDAFGAGSLNVSVEDPDYPPTSPSSGQLMDYDTGVVNEDEEPDYPPTSPAWGWLMGYDNEDIAYWECTCTTSLSTVSYEEDPYYPPTSP